jgi:hypothetical protein
VLVLGGGSWVALSARSTPAKPARAASSAGAARESSAAASPSATPKATRAAAGPAAAAPGAPLRICDNNAILGGGPKTPPPGAVAIPAGDDSNTAIAHNYTIQPHATYWFAPGVHTLGAGQFTQIIPADGDTFIGAPGANQ